MNNKGSYQMKYTRLISLPVMLLISMVAYGENDKAKYVDNFDLKPVVFDSEETNSSSLGIDFNIDGKFLDEKFDSEEEGGINPDVVIGGYDIAYYLKGLLAENYDENPKDFIEARVSANYFRSASSTFKAGVFIKSESDQKFDDRQLAYGLTATFAKVDAFSRNDVLALHLNVGQVDPSKDSSREAVLGNDLESYDRADFELLYIYTIGTENIDTFEVNYRYFQEINAEQAIKDADLDNFRLVTYRLGFKNNLYVAYSSGELPFNQRDNQIYEVGFSYKFE
jgi:hypothetical protein